VHGPGVTLHRIWSAKDELWAGTASGNGVAIAINKPKLYGGKEKGGGFIGTLRFYSGNFDQAINAYYQSKRGAAVTAYRGTSLLVLEHPNIGEQNSLREMSMEISRYTNDLGIPGGKHMVGDDANPMEALFQVFTAKWGGLDVSPNMLDLNSMLAAADTLHAEGNGISLLVSSPNDGKQIASEIMRQIDAIMYNDPATGKIVVKLIRNDFGPIDDLPIFDESNIIGVRGFTRKLWEDTINVVRVKFTNREKKYEPGTAFQDNMANISAQGRIRPITQSYPGVTTPTLANELAARDLSQGSVPLLTAQIETNREGAQLRPGDRFVWSWQPYNLGLVVMRVKDFDLGSLTDNRIVINAVQDEFAISAMLNSSPVSEGTGVTTPGFTANPAVTRVVKEAPYFFAQAAGVAVGASQSLVLVAAEAPANADDYDVYISQDAGVTYNPSEEGIAFSAVGQLNTAVTGTTNLSTGVIPSLLVTIDPAEVDQNTAAGAAQGAGMILIDNELLVYETRSTGAGTVTLSNVWRAILDTSPASHAIGAKVYFIDGDNVIEDLFGFTAALRVKVLPSTFDDQLDLAAAPHDSITLNKRTQRPLPPANVKFDGGAAFTPPATANGPKVLTWANRSRLSQVIRKINDATSENESGQQTVVRHRRNGGAWTTLNYGPGVTTATIDTGAINTDVVDWEIYSSRDGLDSYARWTFTAGAAAGAGSSPETSVGGGGGATQPPVDTTPVYTAPEDSVGLVFPFGENIGTYPIDLPITFGIDIPAGFSGSNVDHRANPASTATFTIRKNGVSVGTVAISAGGAYTLTAASAISLSNGDTLTCEPPASADALLKGVTVTIAGTRRKVV
jgi:hypothetical protein